MFVRNPTTQRRIPRRPESSEEQGCTVQTIRAYTFTVGFCAQQGNGMLQYHMALLNAWRFELYIAHARRAVRLSGVIKSIVGFVLQERI